MTSPILLIAGRFLLASALLMALYWVVWRKQATYRAKRMYLLTMPIVALAISLLQVDEDEDSQLRFFDCGMVNFMITPQALQELRFDATTFELHSL